MEAEKWIPSSTTCTCAWRSCNHALRTHRAAPSSQIKINVVPCNSVYALNMDGNSRVQLCRELSVCINTLSRSQSWRPAQSQIYTSLTTNRTWDFFK